MSNYNIKVKNALSRVINNYNPNWHKLNDAGFLDGIVEKVEFSGNFKDKNNQWVKANSFNNAPAIDVTFFDMNGRRHSVFVMKKQFQNHRPPLPGDHIRAYTQWEYGKNEIRGLFVEGQEFYYKPPVKIQTVNDFPKNDNMYYVC